MTRDVESEVLVATSNEGLRGRLHEVSRDLQLFAIMISEVSSKWIKGMPTDLCLRFTGLI